MSVHGRPPDDLPTLASSLTGPANLLAQRLVAQQLLSPAQVDACARHAEARELTFVDAIVALGELPEAAAYAALAAVAGVGTVDLAETAPSEVALRLVPERVARRHTVLPIFEDNRTLTFATAAPFDDEAERDVAFASGRRGRMLIAPRAQLVTAIERYYGGAQNVDLLIGRIRSESRIHTADTATTAPDSPVVRLCDQLLAKAVNAKASDIHLEPTPGGAVIRYRVHGILDTALTLPREAVPAVTNRFKVLGRIDIGVRNRPQDGAFRARVDNRPVDVRVSTLPTVHGESVVMRIIDTTSEVLTLDLIGFEPRLVAHLKRVLSRPDGLVLLTGPTGCGKTTTLYAALHFLRRGDTAIVTVEDPVERRIDGVNQIHVNSRAGNSFANVLRSVLRQDPNVIMVGEIRDREVADIVVQASSTGHLVLSSVHTTDAPSAVSRLLNLGLEPFKVADTLTAVIAQRLVRRLCVHCRVEHDEVTARGRGMQAGIGRVPYGAGPGCRHCGHTGYVDRVAVAELFVPDDEMRAAIMAGAPVGELRQAMRSAGFKSMRECALDLVADGQTSLDEVNRVLTDETATGAPKHPVAQAPRPRRVLVTDDDRMLRLLVKMLLEKEQKEQYEVLEAANGLEALEVVRTKEPDVMLLDLVMPGLDGYQTLEAMASGRAPMVPTVVFTSTHTPSVEAHVFDLGAVDYLQKPFEPDVLLARLRGVFRRTDRAIA
jgi:type IV pilus assembly protein PilB